MRKNARSIHQIGHNLKYFLYLSCRKSASTFTRGIHASLECRFNSTVYYRLETICQFYLVVPNANVFQMWRGLLAGRHGSSKRHSRVTMASPLDRLSITSYCSGAAENASSSSNSLLCDHSHQRSRLAPVTTLFTNRDTSAQLQLLLNT